MTLLSHVLPPVLGYFAMAILAVTPQTCALRVALWPCTTLLAFRAAIWVEKVLIGLDQRFNVALFVFSMIFMVTRTLYWALQKESFVRCLRPGEGPRSTIMDALDLAFTLRGDGWEWSQGVYIPYETRPMDNKGFILHITFSAAAHALLCGVLHTAIRPLSLRDTGTIGGSIFDATLPLHLSCVRATVITLFATSAIYAFIQLCYDVCTLVGVLLLGHPPALWPPAFDAPWRATSMSQFWGRRWHQFFRHTFLIQGGYPLGFLFGQPGLVCGTFLSSGVLHHIAMIIIDDRLETWRLVVGFSMMAPVMLAERAFKRFTGRKVDGPVGWMWTAFWLMVWGDMIIDGFARAGMLGRLDFMESVVPRKDVVERLAAGFDAWLHGTE